MLMIAWIMLIYLFEQVPNRALECLQKVQPNRIQVGFPYFKYRKCLGHSTFHLEVHILIRRLRMLQFVELKGIDIYTSREEAMIFWLAMGMWFLILAINWKLSGKGAWALELPKVYMVSAERIKHVWNFRYIKVEKSISSGWFGFVRFQIVCTR